MFISTKGRYGLKAMIDIAVYAEASCVSIKSVAERQGLSPSYLEQLIAPLKKSGLVKSVRGAKGGYVLGRQAEDIAVGTILRVLEENTFKESCLDGVSTCKEDCSRCVSKKAWIKINHSMNEAADSITLKFLADEYKMLLKEDNK